MAITFDPKADGSSNINPGLSTHRAGATSTNDFNPKSPGDNAMLQTSTNIFIYANGGVVGMIQSFSVSESRNINKLQAIGYEGVIQAVPSNTNGGQLSVTRMALYNSNIFRALGLTSDGKNGSPIGHRVNAESLNESNEQTPANRVGPEMSDIGTSNYDNFVFRTLRDQRLPLEIKVRTRIDGVASPTQYQEDVYVDCWLSSYSKSFSVSQITVAENATIQYGDVY